MGCGHEITAFFTADTCAGMLDRIVFFCDIIDRACPETVFVEAACSRKGSAFYPSNAVFICFQVRLPSNSKRTAYSRSSVARCSIAETPLSSVFPADPRESMRCAVLFFPEVVIK